MNGDEASTRIDAIIFDMDGLLVDSEVYWERARTQYCAQQNCSWREEDELAAKGKNSVEWADLIERRCAVAYGKASIVAAVADRVRELYEEHLPLMPGAVQIVRELARTFPLGLASSSPRSLIDHVLLEADVRECFTAIVSSDEVGRGKPSPDVFLATGERLSIPPQSIVVFEDSSSGIAAAIAAGMRVIAVPNPHFPPTREALARATIVLNSLEEFRIEMLTRIDDY